MVKEITNECDQKEKCEMERILKEKEDLKKRIQKIDKKIGNPGLKTRNTKKRTEGKQSVDH